MYQSNIYEYLENLLLSTEKKLPFPLLICKDDKEAIQVEDIAKLLGFYTFVLPDIRVSVGEDLRPYTQEIQQFFNHLRAYSTSTVPALLISPIRTVLLPFPHVKYFDTLSIEFAQTLSLGRMKEKLYHWGYHFTDIATSAGEVSFRGDIMDIYPSDKTVPYRISFFDEEVESIHPYDISTQKREEEEIEVLRIPPAFLALNSSQYEDLKYRVEQSKHDTFVKDIHALGLWHLEALATDIFSQYKGIFVSNMDEELKEIYELDEPLVSRKSFLLPTIPEGEKYRDLEAINPHKILETHKDKKITMVEKKALVKELREFSKTTIKALDDIIIPE